MLMETFKKQMIWYMLAIIIVLAIALNYETEMAKKYKKSANTLENTISDLNQKIKLSDIKINDSVIVKQAEVKSLAITKKNAEALHGDILKASDTKAKDVQTLTKIETITAGTDTVVCLVDSFGGLKAHWIDPYINIQVDIDSTRKAIVDYSVKDSLTIINYQKKHSLLFGLIKWKSYEGCKVITHNPKATPVTAVSYSLIK